MRVDLHVIFTIGEYAFKRILTGWFIKLLVVAAVLVLVVLFMGGPEPQKDFLDHKSFVLDMIGLAGMIMVTVMGATEIPRDVDTQTILILLSKPVSKDDVVVGKFVGLVYVAVFTVFVLSLVCQLGCLGQGYLVQRELAENARELAAGREDGGGKNSGKKGGQTRAGRPVNGEAGVTPGSETTAESVLAFDPERTFAVGALPDANFIQKVGFRVMWSVLVAGMVILLSTRLGEIPIIGFITMYTTVGFFIFYLRILLKLGLVSGAAQIPLYVLYYAFPNLSYLQVPPENTNLGVVSWSHFILAIVYSLCYAAVLVICGVKSFRGREVAG